MTALAIRFQSTLRRFGLWLARIAEPRTSTQVAGRSLTPLLAVGGFDLREAEELLDWLESQGYQPRTLAMTPEGNFTIRADY
jgi:hypothetical protein